jgi:hypothetical protein
METPTTTTRTEEEARQDNWEFARQIATMAAILKAGSKMESWTPGINRRVVMDAAHLYDTTREYLEDEYIDDIVEERSREISGPQKPCPHCGK